MILLPERPVLEIRVSKGSLRRALLILHDRKALVDAKEQVVPGGPCEHLQHQSAK